MAMLYDRQTARYSKATQRADIAPLRARFLAHLPARSRILDAGRGSGRDSRAFLDAGYAAEGLDGSAPLAELADSFIDQPLRVLDFQDADCRAEFDGACACGNLLHVPWAKLLGGVGRLVAALKPGETLYIPFTHGRGAPGTPRRGSD